MSILEEREAGSDRDASLDPHQESALLRAANRIREANTLKVTALAFIVGLAFGGLLIILTTPTLLRSWGGLFSHPGGTIALNAKTIWGDYELLFCGGVFDPRAVWAAIQHSNNANWTTALGPLSSTLTYATPLILAGLGLAVGFRTNLFDIGGQGQLIGGALGATYVGFTVHAPSVVLVLLEVLAGIAGGLLVAAIPAVLKAFTGAHEVITTMMMNYVMLNLLAYLLLNAPFQRPGQSNGESKSIVPGGQLPALFGWLSNSLQVNVGFLIALVAVGAVAWFLNRSTLGFELQMVGANPEAARNAGISSRRVIIVALCIAGSLVGLAGMAQVSGINVYIDPSIGGTIGFDAIVVALLGRNKPIGVLLASLLFGALDAGGHYMQIYSSSNIDYSLALVIQGVIVFFVATPALIVAMFKLRATAQTQAALAAGGWAK
ncbi:MAG TPA: ABC transporter permease [Acidimicrobiales bacterium]|nr:ABC transporter permease [Acidimicrobiales bacterium]